MIKIIIVIALLVVFWMIFGKIIRKLIQFTATVAFRVIAIIIGILLILSIAASAQTDPYDGFWNDRQGVIKPIVTETIVDTTKSNVKINFNKEEILKDATEITEIILNKAGKVSATIYYEGIRYYKIGSSWFKEGWEQKKQELNN